MEIQQLKLLRRNNMLGYLFNYLNNKKEIILLGLLFLALIFFRFSFLEQRLQFSWDEVNNAWAAKDILIDHKILLLGMPAKLNSGFSIGPLYYYFVALFYWIFHMDPIASGFIAGATSIITFFVLFFVAKKLFSSPVAFVSVCLYSFSFAIINYDRFQWPVNFIPVFSLLIFFFLYKIITGSPKYFLYLAISLGLSFHVHFTSIFYPIIIVCSLPFVPWNKKAFMYFLLSIPLFLVWFMPQIINELQSKNTEIKNFFSYNQSYNHGFHLKRMIQIAPDVFLEFSNLLTLKLPSIVSYAILPLFGIVYIWKDKTQNKIKLCYLIFLWILIPWIIFSLYSGELTDYYFSLIRPIALFTLAYLFYCLFSVKGIIIKVACSLLLIGFIYSNVVLFLTAQYQGLSYHRQVTLEAIKKGQIIQFTEGVPESYMYYMYTHGYGFR